MNSEEIFFTVLELGGTYVGEHGIGLGKREFMVKEYGESEMNLFRQIKAMWDPNESSILTRCST